MSPTRPRLLVITLCAVFALLAESAFATHFRFGYMFWERDLTYFNPANPNEVKVKVTVEAGLRWSYTGYTTATAVGHTNPFRNTNFNISCAGLVQLSPATLNSLSCPPLGLMFNLAGSYTGVMAVEMPAGGTVVVRDAYNNILPTTSAAPPVGSLNTLFGFQLNPIVTQIQPTQDTFYARQVVHLYFDKSKQVRLTWQNNARIVELLDGNASRDWRLQETIDVSVANNNITRSPQTSSAAIIPVINNTINIVNLPKATFDNLVGRWTLATNAQSLLNPTTPSAPSVFSLDGTAGVVTFRPRTIGFYAVQFILTGHDPVTNQARTSVPLDLMFQSIVGSSYTETLATGDGLTTYTATVGQPFSFTVRSTTAPADNSNYTVTINNNVLPAGATVTQPACNGGTSVCVATFNWTPAVTSTASNVCFTSTLTFGQTLIAQSQSLCVTINLNPLETSMAAEPAEGFGGGPTTFRATLRRVYDNAALQGRPIRFTMESNPNAPLCTPDPLTNHDGVATCVWQAAQIFPPPGSPYVASFSAVAGELIESSLASNVVVTKAATTSLDAPTVPTAPFNSVGFPVSVSAVLNRHFTDGGLWPPPGEVVTFTLTRPDSSQVVQTGPVALAVGGVATATFPADTANAVSTNYSVRATYPGSGLLFGASLNGDPAISPVTTFTVRQRTQVTMSAGVASQNVSAPVSAVLVAIPSNAPLAGRQVKFVTAGFPDQVVTTDAAGVATATFTWTSLGAKAVTASFTPNNATELNRSGLEAAESSVANITVQPAQTTLITLGAFSGVSGQATSLTATLKTAANAPVEGATVTFSQVGGGLLGSGITLADGTVSVNNFTPGDAVSGNYRADFAGIPGYAPSTATAAYVINKAATTLATPTVSATEFVGNTLSVSTMLTRTTAPAGVEPNASVTFTLNGPITTSLSATTDVNGVATVQFPALTTRGAYTVSASFATTATLLASSSASAPLSVYQRTQLTVTSNGGFAAAPIALSATLTAVPGNTPIATPVPVTFEAGGYSATAQTLGGTAVASVTFPDAASYSVTASTGAFDFYEAATSPAITVTADAAVSNLDAVTAPATGIVGQSVAVSTVLTRTSPPVGPMQNSPVTFTIAGPNGVNTLTANTDATGVATVSFIPLQGGDYVATAAYAGNTAVTGATSAPATTRVIHPTTMTMTPATGAAGKPLTLSATLATAPGDWGVSGQTIVFTFTGAGAPASASALTDGNGVASVTPVFGATGTFGVTASFANASSFFGDSSAATSVTATNTPPTIIDLPNITAAATSANGRHVDFTSAGNDAEDGALTPVCTASSGTFPIGTTIVTCTVSDAIAVTASDSFTITITNAAPTIVDLSDVNESATSAAGRHVDFTSSGNDAEEGALTPVCSSSPGTFPIGTTTVTCTVTDFAGLTASDSFTITITNNAPTIADLPNLDGEATSAAGRDFTFASTANDTEEGALPTVCSSSPGTFPIGTTTVTCTVTDVTGASASDSFTIKVVDTTAPALTLPTVAPAFATSSAGRVVTYTATALDIVDGSTTVTCSPISGSTFPIATTTVNCSTTDSRGNTSNGSFDVSITNNAPTIADLPNLDGEATSAAGRDFAFTSTANDTEEGALPTVCSSSPGTFPIGTTTVTCTVTDVAGASASDSFTVTVVDTTAPDLTLPTVAPAFATSADGRVVDYTASALDIVDGATTVTCSPVSGSTFPIATTTVNCSTTDSRGNTSTGSFDVSITNTAPTIVDLPDLSGEATSASGRAFTFTSAGDDAEQGALAPVCTASSGTFPIGTTNVTCTVTDVAGLTASDSFTIEVVDTTAPDLTLPTVAPAFATSAAGRVVDYTVSALDIVDGSTTVTCSPISGSTFPIATTTVNCNTSDTRGNTSTGSFDVSITNTAPTIVDLPNLDGEATSPGGRAFTFTSSGDDAEQGALTPVCTASSGTFPIGTTTVSCTVTDVAGYTASDSFTITVVDTTAPVVTYTGNAGSYTADQIVNITCAATDSGSGVQTTTCANISGPAHTFAVGANNFSATATDVAGNTTTTSISFTVTVPPAAVENVFDQFFDSPGEAAQATHTLGQATSAPNATSRAAHLDKLIKDIEKQIGKTLTAAEAATLIALIQNLY
jgi:hypothetical protein